MQKKKSGRRRIKGLCKVLVAASICTIIWNMPFGTMASEAATGDTENMADGVSILAEGKSGDITWKIDSNGLLTLEGTGDYELQGGYPPWHDHASDITSAVVNITGIKSAVRMFDGCNLTSVDLTGFDTSKVTTMSQMFAHCGNFKSEELDLSTLNTSNVTDMSNMFFDCSYKGLKLNSFDTSQVTDMWGMFSWCKRLIMLDLRNFNTAKVTNMSDMFWDCRHLKSLDISSFNTSCVTDMEGMFGQCYELLSIDVSNFDTSKVTDMGIMFDSCEYLTSLDLSSFDMTNVSDNQLAMLQRCGWLTTLHTPINVVADVILPPSAENPKEEKWYVDETGEEVTHIPKGLSKSIKLVRLSQAPNPSKPGQQLPNTLAKDETGFHLTVFCILVSLTLCVYSLKRKYAYEENNDR